MSLILVAAIITGTAAAQGAGYWHTSGAQIYDANNVPVRIAGINWYGFETTDAVVHGLTSQDYKEILQSIQSNGYNTIRIPFSNQVIETPTASSNLNISYWHNFGPINTDLQGLNSLQILDQIINYAGSIGLKVILDNHRSEAGNSAESNGLWYTSSYPESAWINDWTMLAARYANNPTVIGFDLRNEPHNAYSGGSCWDCGSSTNDWHLAAERAGNAVLGVNPQLLIFVEGTDAYNNDYYWWGGNLEGVANSPVTLSVANRLVYSAHDYGPNEYQQSWFNGNTTPASLDAVWTTHWAYISQQQIAPVWLGEFGTENSDSDVQGTAAGSQGQWFQSLIAFLSANPTLNWTNWALNGEDNYGLLDSNYDPTPVDALKQSSLASIQFKLNTGTAATPPAAPSGLTAATASANQINLAWTASTTSGVTYTVYFGVSANSIGTVLASGLTGTSYSATALNPSTTYYFTVAAAASGATSAVSNTASATTQAAATTAAPTGLSATAVSASAINLSWVASTTSGATYNVYTGTSAGSIGTLVASGITATSFAATGLNASTTYYYTVTATANSATSAASSPASATTQAAPAPSAPSGLAATAVSSSQINLTWTASSTSGVTYSVYSGTSLIASGLAGTSYAASGLTANTTYSFTVTAVSGSVSSSASNSASATTQAAVPPSAPTGLTATAVSSSQINLSWTASTTAGVTYSVYSGNSAVASGLGGTSYSATGLNASTTYSYTVVAVSSTGTSTASNAASATTPAQTTPTPAAPSGLSASPASASQINLNWQPSATSGVTYSVFMGTANGVTANQVGSGLTSTNFSVSGLQDSTTYYFTVKAVAGGVSSAASNQASAQTQTLPATPPTGLSATAASSTQINLLWTGVANTGATYSVYYGTSSGAENTLMASGLSSTSYQAGNLTASTTYYFVVRSVSGGGTSSPSGQASATTLGAAAPAAPAGLSATATSTSQINLSWSAVSGGATCNVYAGTASGAETLLASGITGTTYSATGLSASTAYYFYVKAVSTSGTSGASNEASATTAAVTVPVTPPTQPTAPSAPTGLTATASSSTQINLSWSPSSTSGVTYSVYSGSSAGAINTLVASGLGTAGFSVTGLTASTTYFFAVTATNSAGTSPASSPASAATQAPPAPSAPAGLTATASSSSQINLTWTASTTSGVTYSIFSGAGSGGETNAVASGLSGTSYSVTGLTASTAYFFIVKAVSGTTSSTASNEASATTQAAASGGCHVAYTDLDDWGAGFTGALTITNNGSTAWTNWKLTWSYSGNQQLYQSWNGNYTQNGQAVTIVNAAWNGSVAAGGTVSGIGWNANYSGTNVNPTTFYVNGVACH
jgi:endoglucanase